MSIEVANRPLLLVSGDSAFPISSEQARNLIDYYTCIALKPNACHLQAAGGHLCVIRPATLGGGRTFTQ